MVCAVAAAQFEIPQVLLTASETTAAIVLIVVVLSGSILAMAKENT